jgi:hypothetical protein
MTDEQLSALLRLKRYERPPDGYFDKLLTDIHRRQRAELLRRPLWQIALDRIQTFFGERSLGNFAYGGAMAAVALCGAGLMGLFTTAKTGSGPAASALAEVRMAEPAPVNTPVNLLSLDHSAPQLEVAKFQTVTPRAGRNRQPRYIIDSRPPSYEASTVNFSF